MATREDDPEPVRGVERIVRAAIEVIAERGFRGAATSEIARRAGVAEGTIFRHFKTKQLLLDHILEPFVERVLAPIAFRDLHRLIDTDYPDFADFLRAFAHNRLSVAREHVPALRIFLQEVPLSAELRAMVFRHIGCHVFPELLAVIRKYQARGQIRNDPPETVLRILMSALGGYIITRLAILPDYPWDDDLEIERTIRVVARGLRPD
ncbi:transcriptional regulator, TetR family [Nannocystis exedens]|uniref:Transcriptional regulator, TetR family n=1 Tax=Nannocystis exedens TaxID=54 RepID=A0A1I2H8I0_9BACT|nr:TetR/AcrR family transcriptional regulator [Nannocystis exedens]PCC75791.1 putative HTH-type transcriptional regulator YvdT [Nannocystis exedens]SFF25898.1 transcriptional regulator, TetR family [Nannocystis exedens]